MDSLSKRLNKGVKNRFNKKKNSVSEALFQSSLKVSPTNKKNIIKELESRYKIPSDFHDVKGVNVYKKLFDEFNKKFGEHNISSINDLTDDNIVSNLKINDDETESKDEKYFGLFSILYPYYLGTFGFNSDNIFVGPSILQEKDNNGISSLRLDDNYNTNAMLTFAFKSGDYKYKKKSQGGGSNYQQRQQHQQHYDPRDGYGPDRETQKLTIRLNRLTKKVKKLELERDKNEEGLDNLRTKIVNLTTSIKETNEGIVTKEIYTILSFPRYEELKKSEQYKQLIQSFCKHPHEDRKKMIQGLKNNKPVFQLLKPYFKSSFFAPNTRLKFHHFFGIKTESAVSSFKRSFNTYISEVNDEDNDNNSTPEEGDPEEGDEKQGNGGVVVANTRYAAPDKATTTSPPTPSAPEAAPDTAAPVPEAPDAAASIPVPEAEVVAPDAAAPLPVPEAEVVAPDAAAPIQLPEAEVVAAAPDAAAPIPVPETEVAAPEGAKVAKVAKKVLATAGEKLLSTVAKKVAKKVASQPMMGGKKRRRKFKLKKKKARNTKKRIRLTIKRKTKKNVFLRVLKKKNQKKQRKYSTKQAYKGGNWFKTRKNKNKK